MRAFIATSLVSGVAANGLLSDLQQLHFPAAMPAQMQGMMPPQQMQQPPQQQEAPKEELPAADDIDLLCLGGEDAQGWFNIQQKLRYVLPPEAAFSPVSTPEVLTPVLQSVLDDLARVSKGSQDTCGVGKLMIQLVSILASDQSGEAFGEHIAYNEQLTSPILTLLLDIPWNSYQPMWPMMGILSQLAMRRVGVRTNPEEIDGLMAPEMQAYAQAMNYGIANGDMQGLNALSRSFLETGDDGMKESPLAFLTAVFTQAATSESKEEAQDLFLVAQNVMKRMIFTPEDLDLTMTSRWPMWGMAYLASLKTAL